MKDGRTVEGWADERYRGGPENPLSEADLLEAKVRPAATDMLGLGKANGFNRCRLVGGSIERCRQLMWIVNDVTAVVVA